MGTDDQDNHHDAQRERDKQRQLDETRSKFASFTNKNMGRQGKSPPIKPAPGPRQTGLIPMLLFWFVVMGLLYALMTHYLKPKQSQVLANGDLIIPRAQDGHFYAPGTVNGREVMFLVDTGASLVSVSEPLAQAARMTGGVPTTFHTANGERAGRVVDGVAVAVGPLRVTNVKVGVGLSLGDDAQALLGQSFLSKFDITLSQSQMVLRAR
ncbi:clan AA aspartic protease [Rhodoferax sp. 4810]|nr:clan AA aspartic protease [Rhodoferax jenense]